MAEICVLLADDHTLVREGLKILLEREGIRVIAEAADGHAALEAAERARPEVAVLDIAMPRLNGLEVARRLARLGIKTVLLSMYDRPEYVRAALEAGVRGYVLKENAVEELVEAIRRVAAGGYHFAPPVLEQIVAAARARAGAPSQEAREGLEGLTPREREVLQLIVEGYTTEEIARMIHRSVETVRSHRARLMRKLGARNVADLVRFAVAQGLVPGPEGAEGDGSGGKGDEGG